MLYCPWHIQHVTLSVVVDTRIISTEILFNTWETLGFPDLDECNDQVKGFDGSMSCSVGAFQIPCPVSLGIDFDHLLPVNPKGLIMPCYDPKGLIMACYDPKDLMIGMRLVTC